MGMRLLPMSLPELCVHALQLERDLGERYGEYAQQMRDLGADWAADTFRELEMLQEQECNALKAGTQGARLPELSPWEYMWRLTYAPDGLECVKHVAPRNPREALQLAITVERRVESFYSDVAENAGDAALRSYAAKMSALKGQRLAQLEHLAASEARRDWVPRRVQRRKSEDSQAA